MNMSSDSSMESDLKSVHEDFQVLIKELNMDSLTGDKAWKDYTEIKQKFTLEGDQRHWLACSLYVACKSLCLSTVGGTSRVEGNGLSLTRLIRLCNLNLINFFNKAKKWADMTNLKKELREKIERLERNFAVSNVIFKKYQPIFVDLFKDPALDPPKQHRSRKSKKPPCTPGEVFDFCWGLFVRVKADFPSITDDLVNSFHLLLSCVDHVYANAVLAERKDLLNENFNIPAIKPQETELPCILDQLCRSHDGIISEVKSIREHYWKPHLKQFFNKKILKGDPENLSGLLEPNNFELNSKAIRKEYEAYVLSIGEYDERIFLGDDAVNEIGTPTKVSNAETDFGAKIQMARRNLARQFDGNNLIPNTPLSGKHYLRTKEQLKVTPVSTATYLVSRLTNLLGKRDAEPSMKLIELFKSCDNDPTEAIQARVNTMGETFSNHYTAPSDKHPAGSFARMRLKMGVTLYYKTLESILTSEKRNNKPLGNLLESDNFHLALFTCCLEVVIFSYNSQRTFPWILETFNIEAIHFYKVIEIIIRNEDSLPRDVVKHLQRIEEQILESKAWTKESSLWEAIKNDEQGVPSCEEVALPNANGTSGLTQDPTQSPLSHHKRAFSVVKSPMAGDRFKSPVVNAVARRQLFSGGNSQIKPTSPIKAGQSLLASPQKTFITIQGQNIPVQGIRTTANGQQQIIISNTVDSVMNNEDEQNTEPSTPARPRRTGSLGLFFRKVYHLAHLRLEQLCRTLQISDEEIKRKIWTTFEYTLREHTDLMKDRHIDQLLMCSLYIVCKVAGAPKQFTDIMKQYRTQPQAASHVYRSVLLQPKGEGKELLSATVTKKEKMSPPPTPTRLAATSTISADGEERGDLIKFYNTVFMERLQEYSLRFKRSRQVEAPPLSPLPKLRSFPQSPCRKVSESQPIFIRPLKTASNDVVVNNSPHKPLLYNFSRSPAKNLNAINELMRKEVDKKNIGKRLLSEENSTEEVQQQPPIKVQLIGGSGNVVQTSGARVNTRLELVLGDRTHNE